MRQQHKVEIRRQRRIFDDVFKIDEVIVSQRRNDGTAGREERRLVFERGDSVAVLLFDMDRRSAILTSQLRIPALVARRRDRPDSDDGWVTELVAGMIEPGETARQAAIREVREEAGYRIDNLEPIGTYLVSPGGTSERIFIFFAPVGDADRREEAAGDAEGITLVQMPAAELFAALARGAIDDAKLAIAAYWLKDRFIRSGAGKSIR